MCAKVLVLHSGGLDSTTCLYKAQAEGHHTISLGVDYGQRLSVEMLYAAKQCKDKNIDRQVIQVQWSKPERPTPQDRTLEQIRASPSKAFLPGRNIVFLALASAHAAGIGADEIWIGINSIDFSGYHDCTSEFLDAFCNLHRIGVPHGAKIRAPLLNLSKPQIALLARSLGIGPKDTWSCYRPVLSEGVIQPCGRCDACKLHEYAWNTLKLEV